MKMFEVIEFRICDCGEDDCPGEKQTMHFEHKSVEECRAWILRFSLDFYGVRQYEDKNRLDIQFMLSNGRTGTRKFRVDEIFGEGLVDGIS